MMQNAKKIAMLIVKGMEGDTSEAREQSQNKEQGVKTPSENAESNDSRMGVEVAMDKFIKAVEDKDTKKATEAMLEFHEMCSGSDYSHYLGSRHEDENEDNKGDY